MAVHVSMRLFWHDAGWDGTIYRDPAANGRLRWRLRYLPIRGAYRSGIGRMARSLGELEG